MAKKRRETLKEKAQLPSKKQLITVSIVLALITATVSIIFLSQSSDVPFSLKAAIIDQLGESDPSLLNCTFVESVTNVLESHNFTVTYYNETLDVDFFRRLAGYNYGVIILRVHSALREDNSTVDLFTTEKYATYSKYQWEQDHGLIVVGEYLYRPKEYYYAVTSLFIRNLGGRFPKSIVIAMGCWSLKPECEQMAMAFIDKGAKAYVGWTEIVLPKDTDHETFRLLEMLLNENRTLVDALSRTNLYSYIAGNKTIYSHMWFYPSSAENLTISGLISEAKVSSALTAFNNAKNFSPVLIANTKQEEFT